MSSIGSLNSLPYGWSASNQGNLDSELSKNLDLWVNEALGSFEFHLRMDVAERIEEWGGCKEDVLDLSCFELTSLPDVIGTLIFPKKLDLGHNKLTSLPNTFDHLTELEELNLEENRFDTLPDVISRLPALKKLAMEGNPFKNYSKVLMRVPLQVTLSKLEDYFSLDAELDQYEFNNELYKDLDLWAAMGGDSECNMRLQAADRIKFCVQHGSSCLFLDELPLTSLPNMIGNLTTLEEIYLNGTHEIHFPDTMVNLTALEVLDFGKGHPYNKLSPAEAIDSILTLQALDAELDFVKAKELLDWEPKVALKEGLAATIQYFQSSLPVSL